MRHVMYPGLKHEANPIPSATMSETDIQALERFVCENDELLQLEEQVGKFNVFDSLNVARVEIRHSNFLAWLLTPIESHGQGDIFLKSVLMDILRKARQQDASPPLSPVELDGADLQRVEVRREWKNIDLLFVSDSPLLVVAIENKVDSSERDGQLQRYEETVMRAFPNHKPLYVFLTPDGDEASDDNWITYSYADLHRTLARTRRVNAGSVGSDVGTFLDHYLSLIGSRFMENEELDRLCRQIYVNHRRAIDLIWDRVGPSGSGIVRSIREWFDCRPSEWIFITDKQREVEVIPVEWSKVLPPINQRSTFKPEHWLTLRFHIWRGKMLRAFVVVHPTTDNALRQKVLSRLTHSPEEFGFARTSKGKKSDRWTKILNEDVCELPEEDDPEIEPVIANLDKYVANFKLRTAGVAKAISDLKLK
jgi:hypothetical protein